MQTERTSREAKIDALHEQLAIAVEALVTGDDWRRALEFAALFRSRSFNNTLLIATQHAVAYDEGRVPGPTPTYVAGFKLWQRLGRHICKGQSGYQILAPVTARFATGEGKSGAYTRRLDRGDRPHPGETIKSRLVGLRRAFVWDVSQTHGDPLPLRRAPEQLVSQAPIGLWEGLAEAITSRGFGLRLVSNARAIGGANGVTDFLARDVSLRMDMDESAQVKTLAHELGHVMLHGPDDADAALHRGLAEVEAESVALMIGAAHGLDTSRYTIPYVASWASTVPETTPQEIIQSTAERVRTAAVTVLDGLSTPQIGNGDPPGFERGPLGPSAELVPSPAVHWAQEPGARL